MLALQRILIFVSVQFPSDLSSSYSKNYVLGANLFQQGAIRNSGVQSVQQSSSSNSLEALHTLRGVTNGGQSLLSQSSAHESARKHEKSNKNPKRQILENLQNPSVDLGGLESNNINNFASSANKFENKLLIGSESSELQSQNTPIHVEETYDDNDSDYVNEQKTSSPTSISSQQSIQSSQQNSSLLQETTSTTSTINLLKTVGELFDEKVQEQKTRKQKLLIELGYKDSNWLASVKNENESVKNAVETGSSLGSIESQLPPDNSYQNYAWRHWSFWRENICDDLPDSLECQCPYEIKTSSGFTRTFVDLSKKADITTADRHKWGMTICNAAITEEQCNELASSNNNNNGLVGNHFKCEWSPFVKMAYQNEDIHLTRRFGICVGNSSTSLQSRISAESNIHIFLVFS